jgi:hypothetical protein
MSSADDNAKPVGSNASEPTKPAALKAHTVVPLPVTVTLQLLIRSLDASDLSKNFIPLLEQLSVVGSISTEFFQRRLAEFARTPLQTMVVAEDLALNRICASGSLVIEPKFIRKTGLVGHLEDLVVDNVLRKKGKHLYQ